MMTSRRPTSTLFKTFTIGLVLTAQLVLIQPTMAVAQTKTATASTKATPTPAGGATATASGTTQKLKERIERIVDEKREQVKGVLSEITADRRGYIGEIQRISAEAITVKSSKGTTILPLSDDVSLTRKNLPITVEDIEVGQWALVIGSTEDDTFVPESIIVSTTSLRPEPRFVTLGSITTLSKTQLVLTPRGGTETETFILAKNTQYQDLDGAPIKLDQISEELQAIVVAVDKDSTKTATTVRLLTPASALTGPAASTRPTIRPTLRPSASPTAR